MIASVVSVRRFDVRFLEIVLSSEDVISLFEFISGFFMKRFQSMLFSEEI